MSGKAPDPYAVLEVIDRLEIGPIELATNAVRAPYRVHANGKEDVFELAYRYGEPVFDPTSPADRNLAAMIIAQVALNYGLFCREIVFVGPYDAADRRFLETMLAHTAREILALKILRPNPFLIPPATDLPALKRDHYVRATVRFETGAESGRREREEPTRWRTDPRRWGVLSSGGKDSLLTYGLLHELGYEAHPIYLNESGRHWFTALNAFRHFRDHVPETARVWTSSDRLFNWMLRHLPFVRPDFGRVRADMYPIRLWTVAVFLFGALPLLKQRGIGRLAIGDEFDTTVRGRHRGITHYDALYDQSRYFDHALGRYFQRKGFALTQHSLLRQLSELSIEKLLVERFPELLRHQVSCHAAHKEGDRVHPCGRCEKCRRIVAMLFALGGDPEVCGYHPEQYPAIWQALVEDGVHQELPATAHLGHLLHEKELISEPRLGSVPARPHPEAVALRFHPEKSPLDEIPHDLRAPLYRLLLEHVEGAVRRVGRRWEPYDVLADPELERPYPLDRPSRRSGKRSAAAYLWAELTWPRLRERLEEVDIALLPVGAIEQHGGHLPLDTDAFDADHLARLVATACSVPRPLVLPLIAYGVSYHHDDFPGTLSVSNETLARMVYEVGMGAAKSGIQKLVIVNGHGGNTATLQFAAQTINRDAHIFTCVESGETSDHEIYPLIETPNDIHAGEVETSTSLAVRPHLVHMDEAKPCVPQFTSGYLDFTSEQSVDWYARTAKISPSGVLGDPTKASREKGERIWEIMVQHLANLVEHLKELTLEEIYERRY